jgi:hypothetical protein
MKLPRGIAPLINEAQCLADLCSDIDQYTDAWWILSSLSVCFRLKSLMNMKIDRQFRFGDIINTTD